jgi:hypothetical protein
MKQIKRLSRYSTGLRAGQSGFLGSIPGKGWEFFFSPPHPSLSVPGALSLGVKWPVHEADHSPLSSAKVK